jgi:hypothetical protein
MDAQEKQIIAFLDSVVNNPKIKEQIDVIVKRVDKNLEDQPDSIMAWEPIPLQLYNTTLPDGIKSSWVFVLRKNVVTGAERHPNSIQRMMSYKGRGDFQTKPGTEWNSHFLESNNDSDIEKRWISIPINVWHQGVVGDENWAVVSFQTAEVLELIEERPDENDESKTHQKKYEGE